MPRLDFSLWSPLNKPSLLLFLAKNAVWFWGINGPRLLSLLMRWYPRSSGKLGTVLPSKTFSVGTDMGFRGGRQSYPGLPAPSSPGPCCPPRPSREEILGVLDSLLPPAPPKLRAWDPVGFSQHHSMRPREAHHLAQSHTARKEHGRLEPKHV